VRPVLRGVPVRALIGFGLLVGLLHVLDPRDPRTALVSEFAFEHPVITSAAFLLLGAGVAGVGAEVARTRRLAWPAAALLVVAGLGFAALAVFPTDHRGTVDPTTTTGEIHDGVAALSALVLTLGVLLAWAVLRWRAALVVLAVVLAAFWVPAVLAQGAPGLLQRAWLGTLLVSLLPLSRAAASRGSGPPPDPAAP
jgi:hypothetical protein